MKTERFALLGVMILVIGLPLAAVLARSDSSAIELHGRMADNGGWTPGTLAVQAGQPLRLRLTSDDVVHGFAVGQSALPPVDVLPGQWTTTTLVFDQPGKYTFYCTRWCGPNHWRMRGTIEVTGTAPETITPTTPLYVTLNLELDAPHPSESVPSEKPSAARGAALGLNPDRLAAPQRAQSPVQQWQQLRSSPSTQPLSDAQVWDLVALAWRTNTTPERLAEGQQLYAQNCAACHGETGQGDGVLARKGVLASKGVSAPSLQKTPLPDMNMSNMTMTSQESLTGHETVAPVDFTDARNLLGASAAILEGKIIRGGMGTGMPYWGPIFTAEQIQALVDYLWSFQFDQ